MEIVNVNEAISGIKKEETFMELAELFKIFGEPTRLKILFSLSLSGELCVQDIADNLGISQSAISHQLRILKSSKLVKSKREGRKIIYSLADDHVLTIITQGIDHVEE